MDRINALGRGTQLMLVAGVLLFVSLFFAWQEFGVEPATVEFNGWEGFLGVLLGILTIILVAWIVLRILAPDVLRLPFSHALASAALGGLVVFVAFLKLLSIINDEATVVAYIGFILAVLVGVGAWMVVQAAGGLSTLKSELPTMTSMSTTTAFEEAEPTAAPPAPAAPSETMPQASEPATPGTPVAPAPPAEPSEPVEPAADEPDRPRDA
jgi:hypothetical protein